MHKPLQSIVLHAERLEQRDVPSAVALNNAAMHIDYGDFMHQADCPQQPVVSHHVKHTANAIDAVFCKHAPVKAAKPAAADAGMDSDMVEALIRISEESRAHDEAIKEWVKGQQEATLIIAERFAEQQQHAAHVMHERHLAEHTHGHPHEIELPSPSAEALAIEGIERDIVTEKCGDERQRLKAANVPPRDIEQRIKLLEKSIWEDREALHKEAVERFEEGNKQGAHHGANGKPVKPVQPNNRAPAIPPQTNSWQKPAAEAIDSVFMSDDANTLSDPMNGLKGRIEQTIYERGRDEKMSQLEKRNAGKTAERTTDAFWVAAAAGSAAGLVASQTMPTQARDNRTTSKPSQFPRQEPPLSKPMHNPKPPEKKSWWKRATGKLAKMAASVFF